MLFVLLALVIVLLAFFGLADIVGKYFFWAVLAFGLIIAASAAFMSFHIQVPIDVASAIGKVVFVALIVIIVVRFCHRRWA